MVNPATPWTVACHAPPSMGFSRQEYWSGLPYSIPGIFLTQGSDLCRQLPVCHLGNTKRIASQGIWTFGVYAAYCQGFLSVVTKTVWLCSFTHELMHRKKKVKVKLLSRVRLFVTPWTVAYQAPPSMGFSRQESWSGVSFPSPEDLPDSGMEPGSPAL